MKVIVSIVVPDLDRPPLGAPILVQVRDTTFEDAPAPIVASALGSVGPTPNEPLDRVVLEFDQLPDSAIVWAHVDVDRDGRVSRGDFLTVESYPIVGNSDLELEVTVRRV